jgi:hypothetical protein
MTIENLPPELFGALLIALGAVMWGMRAGYLVFVIGVRTVVFLALTIAGVAWYVSSARAEVDNRTTQRKRFVLA